jgi:hypothetical protein
MIESSFDIGPKTEKLRQSLMAPFSFVISPGEDSESFVSVDDVERLPRCGKCGGYYSSFSVTNADSWTCPICGFRNRVPVPDDLPKDNDIRVVINDPVSEEITVLYLALDFHPNDLDAIRPGVLASLKSLTDRPFIVLLGHSDAVFAALCPYRKFYSYVDGVATYTFEGSPETEEICAPVLLLNDLTTIDFSSLIFPPNQILRVMKTVRNLQAVPAPIPFSQIELLISTTASNLRLNPVHFISLVPSVGLLSPKFAPIFHQPFRLDFVTAQFSFQAAQTMSDIPGVVICFGRKNLARHLKSLIRTRTIYQVYQRFRANGVQPSWRRLASPYASDEDQILFTPVFANSRQPVVLDLIPTGKADMACVQITSKMITWSASEHRYMMVLRISTRSIRLSDEVGEIVPTVHPEVLFWLWLTRTFEQETGHVIAGLYRGVAGILKELSDEDPRVASLVSSVCSLKHLDIMSEDEQTRKLARSALCLTPPRAVTLTPEYESENKVAVAGFTVYVDGEGNEAAATAYNSILFGARFVKTVPEWCKAVDPKSLAFLESLMND